MAFAFLTSVLVCGCLRDHTLRTKELKLPKIALLSTVEDTVATPAERQFNGRIMLATSGLCFRRLGATGLTLTIE